ncbi:hypothetical protein WG909_14225 [Peptostreptococcaceae bacterium AGR-M142]
MGSFKFNDIEIESPYDIVSVLDIKMNHGVNMHSTLYLKLICEEYNDFQIFIKTNTKDFIKLSKFDNVIFNGLIESFEVSRKGNLYTLEIKAISATALLDSKVESRSFQDINMLYSSVISTTISNIPQTIFAFNLMDKKIQEPLVQYNETAWEFLKRLASHFDSVLVCDIKDNKPRFYFGFNKKSTISIPQDLFYKANKDIESLNLSIEQLMDTDLFYHEVKTKEMYDLQDEVYFKNKKLYISHIKAEFIKSELIFTYRFSRINGVRQNKIYNENIKGASLEGKVIDSKDEFVKLHLNIDKKQDKATAHWFKVGPISNNVFYLMFEKNTFARLYFPSNKEVEAEVKNSVRKNGSTCSLTKVPQNRYLTTKNNNQMSLKPSSIEFKSNTNLQLGILLEDPMGAKFYSHKNIKFDAVNDIRFYTKKNINIIALVYIRICVPSSMQSISMENEIDLIGNMIFLGGRDRTRFAPFTDDEIIAKEAFNLGKLMNNIFVGVSIAVFAGVAIATGGTFAVLAGSVMVSLGISVTAIGTMYVLGTALSDVAHQEVRDVDTYIASAITGCICGALYYTTGGIANYGISSMQSTQYLIAKPMTQVPIKFIESYVNSVGSDIIYAGVNDTEFDLDQSNKYAIANVAFDLGFGKFRSRYGESMRANNRALSNVELEIKINTVDNALDVTGNTIWCGVKERDNPIDVANDYMNRESEVEKVEEIKATDVYKIEKVEIKDVDNVEKVEIKDIDNVEKVEIKDIDDVEKVDQKIDEKVEEKVEKDSDNKEREINIID